MMLGVSLGKTRSGKLEFGRLMNDGNIDSFLKPQDTHVSAHVLCSSKANDQGKFLLWNADSTKGV